jgi:2,3-diketo-5-methylthio-1-phosphopentane phosphatase
MKKQEERKKHIVFFDFDNTITSVDTIDDLIPRFSRNDRWKELEKDWRMEKIGSRECLKGQMECLDIGKAELDKYLSGIKLDPYFKKLLGLLSKKNIPFYIVSDNFDYILRNVLSSNGLDGLKVYSNRLRITGNRLFTSFPLANKNCKKRKCGHCKTGSVSSNVDEDSTVIYIGDGRSDFCPASRAHIVFAKDDLKDRMESEGLAHIPFNDLKKVYDYFKNELI